MVAISESDTPRDDEEIGDIAPLVCNVLVVTTACFS